MSMNEDEKDDQFNRGYLLAVSNLVNMYGASTEAEELMLALGISRPAIEKLGFDDYDRLPLLKLHRRCSEIRRRKAA